MGRGERGRPHLHPPRLTPAQGPRWCSMAGCGNREKPAAFRCRRADGRQARRDAHRARRDRVLAARGRAHRDVDAASAAAQSEAAWEPRRGLVLPTVPARSGSRKRHRPHARILDDPD
ncbi:CGNR zinc finger domain-containing protein [Actinomadura sp. 9N215]|uniref:CGNR zinc finger domain-containing protein n=1 Tax=Actinomadura sp. 9N215 TaxID=3375150 RepID=UPI0037AE1757